MAESGALDLQRTSPPLGCLLCTACSQGLGSCQPGTVMGGWRILAPVWTHSLPPSPSSGQTGASVGRSGKRWECECHPPVALLRTPWLLHQ